MQDRWSYLTSAPHPLNNLNDERRVGIAADRLDALPQPRSSTNAPPVPAEPGLLGSEFAKLGREDHIRSVSGAGSSLPLLISAIPRAKGDPGGSGIRSYNAASDRHYHLRRWWCRGSAMADGLSRRRRRCAQWSHRGHRCHQLCRAATRGQRCGDPALMVSPIPFESKYPSLLLILYPLNCGPASVMPR